MTVTENDTFKNEQEHVSTNLATIDVLNSNFPKEEIDLIFIFKRTDKIGFCQKKNNLIVTIAILY